MPTQLRIPLNLGFSSSTTDSALILTISWMPLALETEKKKKKASKKENAIDFLMVSLFPRPSQLISYHLLHLSYQAF